MSVNKKEILSALGNEFTTSVRKVFINSSQKEFGFREPTTKEIKTLSKIMIEHENDEVAMYESSLALISALSIDKEFFNISDLTEFDRIKILMTITSDNFKDHPLNITCKKCKHQFKIDFDYDTFIKTLDALPVGEKTVTLDTNGHILTAHYQYPKCSKVLDFLKKKRELDLAKSETPLTVIDQFYLFITRLIVNNKTTETNIDVHMGELQDITEVIEVVETFPSHFIMDTVLSAIKVEFEHINTMSDGSKCPKCEDVVEISFGGVNGFF